MTGSGGAFGVSWTTTELSLSYAPPPSLPVDAVVPCCCCCCCCCCVRWWLCGRFRRGRRELARALRGRARVVRVSFLLRLRWSDGGHGRRRRADVPPFSCPGFGLRRCRHDRRRSLPKILLPTTARAAGRCCCSSSSSSSSSRFVLRHDGRDRRRGHRRRRRRARARARAFTPFLDARPFLEVVVIQILLADPRTPAVAVASRLLFPRLRSYLRADDFARRLTLRRRLPQRLGVLLHELLLRLLRLELRGGGSDALLVEFRLSRRRLSRRELSLFRRHRLRALVRDAPGELRVERAQAIELRFRARGVRGDRGAGGEADDLRFELLRRFSKRRNLLVSRFQSLLELRHDRHVRGLEILQALLRSFRVRGHDRELLLGIRARLRGFSRGVGAFRRDAFQVPRELLLPLLLVLDPLDVFRHAQRRVVGLPRRVLGRALCVAELRLELRDLSLEGFFPRRQLLGVRRLRILQRLHGGVLLVAQALHRGVVLLLLLRRALRRGPLGFHLVHRSRGGFRGGDVRAHHRRRRRRRRRFAGRLVALGNLPARDGRGEELLTDAQTVAARGVRVLVVVVVRVRRRLQDLPR